MKRTFGQPNDVQAVDTFPLGVWKPVEGMHSFRRWQKMPQWGPIAWIWERAARKRHDGAFLGRIFFGALFGKLRDLAFC